jgi:hypothetical protein
MATRTLPVTAAPLALRVPVMTYAQSLLESVASLNRLPSSATNAEPSTLDPAVGVN